MDGLEYQKRLADFEEQIDFLKMQIAQIRMERSRYVAQVLKTTIESRSAGVNSQMPSGINIIKGQSQ